MTSTTAGPHSAVATSTTVVSEVVNTATGHQDGPSTSNQQHPQPTAPVSERLILRLVPKKKKKGKGVKWAEDVVDNEFMNKKKSKKCCIFHKQRVFGEWSDGEDSDIECEACNQEAE